MNGTLELVENAIENKEQIHHVVVNAGKVVQMQKDMQLRESVNSSDIINADGQSVVWAAKFLNKHSYQTCIITGKFSLLYKL